MLDHDFLPGLTDCERLLVWAYAQEAANPGIIRFLVRPSTAFRGCRDCSLNPRAACMRRTRIRRGGRAPRRSRGTRCARLGDDSGGSDDDGGDPPPHRGRPLQRWGRPS
jgi:hypothetical protein